MWFGSFRYGVSAHVVILSLWNSIVLKAKNAEVFYCKLL